MFRNMMRRELPVTAEAPQAQPQDQSDPPRRPLRQPPPMREVTKGWFTMREEEKTLEELQAADASGGLQKTG